MYILCSRYLRVRNRASFDRHTKVYDSLQVICVLQFPQSFWCRAAKPGSPKENAIFYLLTPDSIAAEFAGIPHTGKVNCLF